MEQWELSDGWAIATLSELIDEAGILIDGDWIESKDQDPNGDVRLIQLSDIGDGFYRNRSNRYLTSCKAKELQCTFLKQGDVLIARMPDPLGRACIFPGDEKPCITAVDVCIVRPGNSGIQNKWILHTVNSPQFRNFIEKFERGTTRKRISRKNLISIEFPIPPLAEQKRIVAKVEALLARVNAARERLEKVPAILKRFRQSVLAAACSGRLTEDWREDNPNLNNAQKIIDRISKERKDYWINTNIKKKGRFLNYSELEKKYKAESILSTDLPELPKSWKWIKWEDIAANEKYAFKRGPFGSALKKEIFVSEGYKVYEQCNPINDNCNLGKYYITEEKYDELIAFKVKSGDLLISCSGVTLGRITEIPLKYKEGIINQALLKISLNKSVIINSFFIRYFRSEFFQKLIFDNSRGSAIPNVKGVNELKKLPIPLCSIEEQHEIVRRVEALFKLADTIESQVQAAKQRVDRLTQSILAKAFRGELVPTEAELARREGREYETAAELLERMESP